MPPEVAAWTALAAATDAMPVISRLLMRSEWSSLGPDPEDSPWIGSAGDDVLGGAAGTSAVVFCPEQKKFELQPDPWQQKPPQQKILCLTIVFILGAVQAVKNQVNVS